MLQTILVYPQSRNMLLNEETPFRSHLHLHRSPGTKLCAVRWICHSVDCLTSRGSIVPVVLTSDGWIKSVTETVDRPLMCGEMLSDQQVILG